MISKKLIKINDKKLIIYDGIFTAQQRQDIHTIAVEGHYQRNNIDIAHGEDIPVDLKWSSDIEKQNMLYTMLLTQYKKSIDELKQTPFEIKRLHVNFATLETVDKVHTDSTSSDEHHYTILQYANHLWKMEWHGETLFYDDDGTEIEYGVTVKPGRVIMFDSRIPHSAIAPSRVATYPRYTIATKIFFRK
jgi:hypothetical protein